MDRRWLVVLLCGVIAVSAWSVLRSLTGTKDGALDYEAHLGRVLAKLVAEARPDAAAVTVLVPDLEEGRVSAIDQARLRGIRSELLATPVHEVAVEVDPLAAQTGGEVMPLERFVEALAAAPEADAVISLVGPPARVRQLGAELPSPRPALVCLAVYGEAVEPGFEAGVIDAAVVSRPDIAPVDETLPSDRLAAKFQLEFMVRRAGE